MCHVFYPLKNYVVFVCFHYYILLTIHLSVSFYLSTDKEKFKLPKNLGDAKDLGRVLSNYKDEFFLQVVLGFMATYILYLFGS